MFNKSSMTYRKIEVLRFIYQNIKNGRNYIRPSEIVNTLKIPFPTVSTILRELRKHEVAKARKILYNDGSSIKVIQVYEIDVEKFKKYFERFLKMHFPSDIIVKILREDF